MQDDTAELQISFLQSSPFGEANAKELARWEPSRTTPKKRALEIDMPMLMLATALQAVSPANNRTFRCRRRQLLPDRQATRRTRDVHASNLSLRRSPTSIRDPACRRRDRGCCR